MQVPKDLIVEAKNKLGDKAIDIIIEDLEIDSYNPHTKKAICPFHNDSDPSLVWYDEGDNFFCFSCSKSYDIVDHYIEFYSLSFLEAIRKLFEHESVGIDYSFALMGEKLDKKYKYPKYDASVSRDQVEEYLALRKISKTTLDYCDVQQSNIYQDAIVFNYYDENDVLTSVKYRPSKKLEKGDTKCWFQDPKIADNRPILYNMNRVDPTKPLLITEGEIDTLAAIEAGYRNSVSVPTGAKGTKWIEENFDWLEQFDQIIIWSDNDDPGIEMRKTACARLGAWRSLYVTTPSEVQDTDGETHNVKDINEVLFFAGKEAVLDLIKNAQEMPIEGVDNLASIDDFDLDKAEGLVPRLKPLGNILYKFLFGSIALVTGMKGAGKSSMINQLFVCDPLDAGYDIFLFSGELGAPVLKSWLERTMAGREHTQVKHDFVHVIEPEVKEKMRQWYNNRIWVYNESDNNADKILKKAIATTRKYGTKIWILDNLMSLDIGANDSNIYQKQKDFIVKLNKYALLYNVLVVLVAHPRKLMAGASMTTDDIAGSSDLGNLAQYIMSVRRYNEKEKKGEPDGRGGFKKGKGPIEEDSELRIMKNRYTGKIGSAKLYFDYDSYRFWDKTEDLYHRYKWNDDQSSLPTESPRRTTYDQNSPF